MLIENTPGLSNIAIAAFSRQAQTARERPESGTHAGQKTRLDQISSSQSDSVEISEEARNRSSSTSPADTQLNEEEARQLRELKARDREVRTHEQAHRSGGGQYVRGGTKFEYQRGPDGQLYAVGGEVQIDTSKVPDDPEATIRKMRAIRSAALAPSNPSPADRRVAAEAARKEAQARVELQRERSGESGENGAVSSTGIDGQNAQSERTRTGPAARGSIQPFLDNQRVTASPGEILNIFA